MLFVVGAAAHGAAGEAALLLPGAIPVMSAGVLLVAWHQCLPGLLLWACAGFLSLWGLACPATPTVTALLVPRTLLVLCTRGLAPGGTGRYPVCQGADAGLLFRRGQALVVAAAQAALLVPGALAVPSASGFAVIAEVEPVAHGAESRLPFVLRGALCMALMSAAHLCSRAVPVTAASLPTVPLGGGWASAGFLCRGGGRCTNVAGAHPAALVSLVAVAVLLAQRQGRPLLSDFKCWAKPRFLFLRGEAGAATAEGAALGVSSAIAVLGAGG